MSPTMGQSTIYASLVARVDYKIHGHAEAGDVRALWTQEWVLKKASEIDTRR